MPKFDELLKSLDVVQDRTNPEDGTREMRLGCSETITKDDLERIVQHPDFIAIGADRGHGGIVLILNNIQS
jgi:hypothetical protein